MLHLKNFWRPPASGYDSQSCGLTAKQLAAIEARNGFALPTTYRELMQKQNGASLRYTRCDALLVESFWPLSVVDQNMVTFEDYMLLSCEQEEISQWKKTCNHCNLQRLVVFACDAHEIGCFDYGWQADKAYAEPQIIFFCDHGNEFLHFDVVKTLPSFDEFVKRLQLSEHAASQTFLGVQSGHTFDQLCVLLAQAWGTEFAMQHNNRSGWFNFETWFRAGVPLHLDDVTLQSYAHANGTTFEEVRDWAELAGRTRQIASIISPNQHRAGTYLYPGNPELTLVLEIPRPWFPVHWAIARLIGDLMRMDGVLAVKQLA